MDREIKKNTAILIGHVTDSVYLNEQVKTKTNDAIASITPEIKEIIKLVL